MMAIVEPLIQEIDREGATTKRVLERVPADRLTWKPHHKSRSLGELAMHIATTPGHIASWALNDEMDFAGGGGDRSAAPASTVEIVAAHDESMTKAKEVAQKLGDTGLMREWEGKMNGATIFKMPKIALYRSIVLNHWIHHRGQLSVYLRMLDVPVPAIYGPSADENPFAARV
jgi:uncharacterized damage-inducible protein DinB